MSDDWRVTVELPSDEEARDVVEWLRDIELEGVERDRVGERVIVSRDGRSVFLYADSEERARSAARMLAARIAHPATGRVELSRWHPTLQAWEDAAVPLPRTEEEWRAEHERQQAREAEESRRSGGAAWEVRVELPDHAATVRLAERLERDGLPVVRRYTYLLVGAGNEDEARELASQLQDGAPEGARVEVEPGGRVVWEVMPANPFAVFGGLGM